VRGRPARPATALLVLAFAALFVSVLHGAVPHHSLPGPCHDCEALSSPAEIAPDTIAVAPITPDRPSDPISETRLVELPARRPGPPRAPPADLAA
jgi:hypothetical protein